MDYAAEKLVVKWSDVASAEVAWEESAPDDWHSFVPSGVRMAWPDLPMLARCAVIETCQARVDNERGIY